MIQEDAKLLKTTIKTKLKKSRLIYITISSINSVSILYRLKLTDSPKLFYKDCPFQGLS